MHLRIFVVDHPLADRFGSVLDGTGYSGDKGIGEMVFVLREIRRLDRRDLHGALPAYGLGNRTEALKVETAALQRTFSTSDQKQQR